MIHCMSDIKMHLPIILGEPFTVLAPSLKFCIFHWGGPGEQERCTAEHRLGKVERLVVGLGQSKMCSSVPGYSASGSTATVKKEEYQSIAAREGMRLVMNPLVN